MCNAPCGLRAEDSMRGGSKLREIGVPAKFHEFISPPISLLWIACDLCVLQFTSANVHFGWTQQHSYADTPTQHPAENVSYLCRVSR